VGAAVPALLGKPGRRAEVAAGSGARAVDQGKEQCGVTVDGAAGHRAGAAGRPTEYEQAGSPSMCGAGLSFPYVTGATEETHMQKNEQTQSRGLLG
jgi:hypothetical protein